MKPLDNKTRQASASPNSDDVDPIGWPKRRVIPRVTIESKRPV